MELDLLGDMCQSGEPSSLVVYGCFTDDLQMVAENGNNTHLLLNLEVELNWAVLARGLACGFIHRELKNVEHSGHLSLSVASPCVASTQSDFFLRDPQRQRPRRTTAQWKLCDHGSEVMPCRVSGSKQRPTQVLRKGQRLYLLLREW